MSAPSYDSYFIPESPRAMDLLGLMSFVKHSIARSVNAGIFRDRLVITRLDIQEEDELSVKKLFVKMLDYLKLIVSMNIV